jgi:hypothetical protein
MTKLTESAIEDFAIELFEKLGYNYVHEAVVRKSRTTQHYPLVKNPTISILETIAE